MGKKKRSSQNSNNAICQRDSSDSESPNDSSQITEASKVCCNHIKRSTDTTSIKKNLKSNKDAYLMCSSCKKSEGNSACKDGWVCLQCGSYNCGANEADHKMEHYKKAYSDPHYLAYQLSSNTIWCFKCEKDIPVDGHKRLQRCVEIIKKQYSDNLLYKPIQRDTDTRKMNGNNALDYLKSDVLTGQSLQNSLQNKDIKPDLNLPKVRGLINLGNTCFFNSVLQCLAQTPGLVKLLEEMDVRGEKFQIELDGITIDAELEKHKSSEVSEQLARVLTEVAGGGGNGDGDAKTLYSTVNPRALLKALTNKCPQFEGGDQHDAHELLRHLLDSVYKEDLKRYQAAILNHIGFYDEAKKNLDDLDEEKKKFGKKLNQKVCDTILIRPDHLFKGSLVSILQCQACGHKSKREETFLDLSLPVALEKAQPPVLRRKQNNNADEVWSIQEKDTTEETSTMSKCQLNKLKRQEKRILKKEMNAQKKEENKGEPTIEEEKKDSIDGEQTDADVEDNEDIACEEQDPKTEIVESGYSSEKQMSARGSPVTTQSMEDQSCDFDKPMVSDVSVYSTLTGLPGDSGTRLAKRAESGLGSNQELTVAIPEENNPDCTSQESVRVNGSNGSPDISSDSQQGNFRNVDLSSEYQLPLGSDSNSFRRDKVLDWNCAGAINEPQSHSQDSSSASMSVSPGCSRDNNVSPKGSDPLSGSQSNEISVCTSLPNSNDNMSICDSLPENASLLLNSPNKKEDSCGLEEKINIGLQQQEKEIKMYSPDDLLELDTANSPKENSGTEENINLEIKNSPNVNREAKRCSPVDIAERVDLEFPREENSGPEELVNLKLENQKIGCRQISRCSPVEPGELTELDSGLLKLSLEGMTCAGDTERRSSPVTTDEANQPVYNDQGQSGFVLVGGVMSDKSSIPLPPPSPPTVLFTAPYKFSHPEPAVPRYEPVVPRYDSVLYQRHRIEEGECSLQSCLNQFTTIEMLTGGNKVGCDACTERLNKGNKEGKTVYQHSSKQLLIYKLPPVVIFHLKRFQVQSSGFRKISRPVLFPLVLDISPFCSFDESEKRKAPIFYSLYGVVEHSGTMYGGHYVAYVKVRSPTTRPGVPPPGKWYYISDSRVSSIEEGDVLTKQAYLLFYEKIL